MSGQVAHCGGNAAILSRQLHFDRSTLGLRANARWGLEVRDMFGPEVRAEAPVLSAFVALLMIVVGTISIAVPLALAIILICS